jgi:hypothetical protein
MIDLKRIREMTSREFCLLGANDPAYVKPIITNDVHYP